VLDDLAARQKDHMGAKSRSSLLSLTSGEAGEEQ
jgi:hypothetical protein